MALEDSVRESQAGEMDESILSLKGYGVAFGDRIVLGSVTMDVPERGVTVLVGPGGTGKSTLLRSLAGFNSANPSLRSWGDAWYAGEKLDDGNLPVLVSQSARLMMASILENVVNDLPERHTLTPLQQRDLAKRLLSRAGLDELSGRLDESVVGLPLGQQRHIAILRMVAAGPKLLCIDEPTTGLDEASSTVLLNYIHDESTRRAILVVLHNQEHALRLGGQTALLAGGRIQEMSPTEEFLASPVSKPGKDFVRNGSCAVPAPDANPEDLDAETEPPPPLPERARQFVSDAFGPRGFLWLKKGMLAGTPRPGIMVDLDYDLKSLRRVGVTVLVSLTQKPVEPETLKKYGIKSIWAPIPDMGAPKTQQAKELCQRILELTAEGEVIAVHCRAGLGRTGTVLAACLIWEGRSALEALETVRRIEPRWVQSAEQIAFLEEFAHNVANDAPLKQGGASGSVKRQHLH